MPASFAGDPVRLQARRDRTRCFNRLLIEAGLFSALAIEALRPDGDEVVARGIGALNLYRYGGGICIEGETRSVAALRAEDTADASATADWMQRYAGEG